MTPWAVLMVPPTASKDAVRLAYKALAQRHHPDKGGDLEKFREVVSAFEALSSRAPHLPSAKTVCQTCDGFGVLTRRPRITQPAVAIICTDCKGSGLSINL